MNILNVTTAYCHLSLSTVCSLLLMMRYVLIVRWLYLLIMMRIIGGGSFVGWLSSIDE